MTIGVQTNHEPHEMTLNSRADGHAHPGIPGSSIPRRLPCVLGILAVLGISAPTASLAQQGSRKISNDVIACKDKAVRERLTTLRDSGDKAAFHRFGTAALTSGACRELSVGLTVYLEVGSMFDYVCLRPAGESQCYWTFPQAIK